MKKILYITRVGLLEPIGQSQVLSYVIKLANLHLFFIVSFEKHHDFENIKYRNSIEEICNRSNIKWFPIVYKDNYRMFNIILGFLVAFGKCIKLIIKENINLIHMSSYYPMLIVLTLNKLFRIPFIFDMRALWPEELVQTGRLKEKSIPWNVIKFLEKKCLKKAFAVVSLTHAAVEHLEQVYPEYSLKQKTTVIPTCANLERFRLKTREFTPNSITISCIGSMLSGWFQIDVLKAVVEYMLSNYPNIRFEFLTRDCKEELLLKIDKDRKWTNRIHIDYVLFKDMPSRLAEHDGSVFFFTANISKLGSAPTRMAELLGTGIPVLTNSGVGDVDKIVLEHKVGELLNSENETDIKIACDNFIMLIKKENIAQQCRYTAETLFALDVGVRNYRTIYNKIV